MSWKVLIESVDRTLSVQRHGLSVTQRADQRNECDITFQTRVEDWLPEVGQDLKVIDLVSRELAGIGDGIETEFSVDGTPILADSVEVFFDDSTDPEDPGDYEVDYQTGVITFDSAPGDEVEVYVSYAAILFGGVIRYAPVSRISVLDGEASWLRIEVNSDGYHHIPLRRTIITDWSAIDAGDIVTYLITEFLHEEGIVAGTIDTGAHVDQYTRRVVSIKDVLDDMASLSGFKWWIDDFKALHFVQESPVVDTPHPISEEGLNNYNNPRIEHRMELYRNKQFIYGGGEYVYLLEDEDEVAARAAIEGGTGVYGNVYEDFNIVDDATAGPIAQNLLKKFGRIPVVLTFESHQSYWRGGTRLLANLPSLGIPEDRYFLIDEVVFSDRGADLNVSVKAVRRRSSLEEPEEEEPMGGVFGTGVEDEGFSTQRQPDYVEYFEELTKKSKIGGSGGSIRSPVTLIVGVSGQSLHANRADIVIPANHTNATPYIQQAADAMPWVTIYTGTATGGGANYVSLPSTLIGASYWYAGARLTITSGTGSGQVRTIKESGPGSVVVSSNFSVNPDNTSVVRIDRRSGRIVLLEGRYSIATGLELYSGLTLQGQGAGTRLVATSGWDDGWHAIWGKGHCAIRDLEIDMRAALAASVKCNGIVGHLNDAVINNVTVLGTYGSALWATANSNRLTVDGFKALDCDDTGTFSHTRCVVGVLQDSFDVLLTRLHIDRANATTGVWFRGSTSIIANNYVANCGNCGIYLLSDSWNTLVANNVLWSNGGDGLDCQILVYNADKAFITGNLLRGDTNSLGIDVWDASERTLISNNDCYTAGADFAIKDDGINTSFGAGNRVNDGSWLVGQDYVAS